LEVYDKKKEEEPEFSKWAVVNASAHFYADSYYQIITSF
jgi:hypothetical protein